MPIRFISQSLAFLIALLIVCSPQARALEPDEILLLVNQNVLEGRSLAEFYQSQRNIPPGRILALDLPRGEDIAHEVYHKQVVPRIREHLQKNGLENKITCIVTFFGTPLRIGARQITADEKQEMAELQEQQRQLLERTRVAIESLEAEAVAFDPQFRPATGASAEQLAARAEKVMPMMARQMSQANDPQARQQRSASLLAAVHQLYGLTGLANSLKGQPDETVPGLSPPMTFKEFLGHIRQAAAEIRQLDGKIAETPIRIRLRELVREMHGAIGLAQVIQSHLTYLNPASSVAAFDSELSLLWWDGYPSSSWQINPRYYRLRANPNLPRTLMVTRLDAPQPGMVRDLIVASLKAEREGLKGRVVLDCRGMTPKSDAETHTYAGYDQGIRNLAKLIATKTKLHVLLDESQTLLPPGSAMDVALYCGWYSVRNYVPCSRFNPGAVGFHVASFELISLRNVQEKGWVRGLLNDGIAATLGSVAEPYLTAFPAADDFFPLLLTGRLPLAEVYWNTLPLTSWMMSFIGDPLYTPYKNNPALQVDDLPDRLGIIFQRPTSNPSTAATDQTSEKAAVGQ